MKKFILTGLIAMLFSPGFAQQTVRLNIQHKLGTQNFAMNQASANNLGHDFELTRLQYYISAFEIIHDGGQTAVTSGVYYLADASLPTSIDLGSHSGITNIEAIKFAIGVKTPENNQDPALWPATHALSPKVPSMHWGWASGYFFVALEGNSGPALNQNLEMHALGNSNYFTQTINTGATLINNEHIITIKADYNKAVQNVNISNGMTLHGSTGANQTMLASFRDSVFSAVPTQTASGVGLNEQTRDEESLTIYPNPSSGIFTIDTKDVLMRSASIRISDLTGRTLQIIPVTETSSTKIKLESQGIYFVSLHTGEKLVTTKKIMVY